MNTKNILFIIGIVLWCLVIFYASSRTSNQSNGKSKKIIYDTVKVTTTITNKLNITNKDLSNDKWLNNVVNKLNYPLRKVAHATVYFILSILIMLCLKSFGIEQKKAVLITISICFIYSMTDEFHQLFINGRTGQFSDCIIDTLGATIGSILTKVLITIL